MAIAQRNVTNLVVKVSSEVFTQRMGRPCLVQDGEGNWYMGENRGRKQFVQTFISTHTPVDFSSINVVPSGVRGMSVLTGAKVFVFSRPS